MIRIVIGPLFIALILVRCAKVGEFICLIDEDIFMRFSGKWFDVADYPIFPRYNKDNHSLKKIKF